MTNEAQIWKDRYFALKRWVENNMSPKVQTYKEDNISDATISDWNDFWESREK